MKTVFDSIFSLLVFSASTAKNGLKSPRKQLPYDHLAEESNLAAEEVFLMYDKAENKLKQKEKK